MDGKPTTISMTAAEMALYQSGIKRGHAECLQQMATQMNAAATEYREKTTGGDNMIVAAFEAFAKQLDEPTKQAATEQHSLLDKWCALRAISNRTVSDKVKAAINGALAGWRGQ